MATETRTWPVGDRTVTLRVSVSKSGVLGQATLSWSPDKPAKLTGAEWIEFRLGRRQALAELALRYGREPELVREATT